MSSAPLALAVALIAGCGGPPPPAPVIASNTAATSSEPAAPVRTLAGTYLEKRTTVGMCEDGSGVDCEEVGEDRLVIRESGDGSIAVELETLGANFHTCTFEGTLQPVEAGRRYRLTAPPSDDEGECELTLDVTATLLTITANGCRYYCGMRATLDSTFTRP